MLDATKPAVADVIDEAAAEDRSSDTSRKETETVTSKSDSHTGKSARGLKIARVFSREGVNPFDEVKWEKRDASITNEKGEAIFSKKDVEVPEAWSMLATNIVASKYLYGNDGTDVNETSVRTLIHRVARTIADWGLEDGYFASPEDAEAFYNELSFICINQYGAFNSPVWFNVGLHHVHKLNSRSQTNYCWNEEKQTVAKASDSYKAPQASACFIQAVNDTMDDIMRLATSEAMLFKYGSGTGTDMSTLRSSREKLSGGGIPSGPLSFMRVFDQIAAVIKSGGKTRRAAKMQSLKVDHPDIMEFIACKHEEEKKAKALVEMGYDGSFNGEAYSSVAFQNANLSVRVYDEFMHAVIADTVWHTRAVTTGEIVDVLDARKVMRRVAEMAHVCGDPGLQYDTTVNRWHTCPNSDRINASNPCSEYMFVDNSACNLASINLMKFSNEKKMFDVEKFRHTVRMFIIAQDILVDRAGYPTREIAMNSHKFRPLGLGYANLGALVMSLGLPYDSDEGRGFAGVVSSILTGTAYQTSTELAGVLGTFEEYAKNKDPFLDVIKMHREECDKISQAHCPPELLDKAMSSWDSAIENGKKNGFRNAQVSVLAPTGTIGFMMDCDTTGVEPDIALVKYKQLAGGGMLKITNRTLLHALKRLGYSTSQIDAAIRHVEDKDTIEGCPELKEQDLPVFDCAFKPKNGTRFLSYNAHLKMMAAVQPFISGAISKTINMPTDTSVDDVYKVFMDGWKLGLKAVTIYRDGSKGIQPVSTEDSSKKKDKKEEEAGTSEVVPAKPFRRRMPATRQSITHKFEVTGHQGYITVGLYENGAPGEVFITMAKEGSTVGGIMDAFGIAISMCLQYGVPLQALTDKLTHTRFEPSGFTKNPDIPYAKSLVDYIFRWMALTFPDGRYKFMNAPTTEKEPLPEPKTEVTPVQEEESSSSGERVDDQFKHLMEDAPVCDQCGAITVRNGTCYRCYVCGSSMGCS